MGLSRPVASPDWDTTKASVKYWKPRITPMTTAKKITGEIIGRVTCRNRCQGPAPSSSAAS